MSQSDKAHYYRSLKAVGVDFKKHYREYTESELKDAYDRAVEGGLLKPPPEPQAKPGAPDGPSIVLPPVRPKDPDEMAGARQNTKPEDEPIRVDDQGRIWFQEEVTKPSYPKPRGRRVLKYMDTGTKTVETKTGQFTETFEVAGDKQIPSEIRITLPSYQVGIYKDPRFPFKIHTYNGLNGFDLFEVENYYGGQEMVPPDVKRVYVENVLCYDIRTVVRNIQSEYRRLQLAGKV